jgi:O-antigen ligase
MILFLILILVLPLKRHPWLNLWFGPASVPQWLGLACFLYAVGYMLFRQRVPSYLATWHARWYLLLTTLMLLSYFTAGASFAAEGNPAISTVSMLSLGITTIAVVDTIARLRWTLLALIASVGWASTYVLREAVKMRAWATGARTWGWVVGDTNIFGVCVALVLPLAWYMSQEKRPRWEKVLCFGSAGLMLLATVISGSRGGFLGAIAGALVVLWRSRRRWRNLTLAIALIAAFNVGYPGSPLRRILHPTERDTKNAEVRLIQWNIALEMVKEHPIGGIGYGQFRQEMIKYVPDDYEDRAYLAHNAFLGIAAEVGIPASLVFIAMFFSALRSLGRIRKMRSVPPLVQEAATGLQAGVFGGMVAVFFVSAFEHRTLWFVLFLSMSLAAVAKQVARKTVAAAAGDADQPPEYGSGTLVEDVRWIGP